MKKIAKKIADDKKKVNTQIAKGGKLSEPCHCDPLFEILAKHDFSICKCGKNKIAREYTGSLTHFTAYSICPKCLK